MVVGEGRSGPRLDDRALLREARRLVVVGAALDLLDAARQQRRNQSPDGDNKRLMR